MVIANITYVLMYILHLHVGTCMRLRLHTGFQLLLVLGGGGGEHIFGSILPRKKFEHS